MVARGNKDEMFGKYEKVDSSVKAIWNNLLLTKTVCCHNEYPVFISIHAILHDSTNKSLSHTTILSS